MGDAFFFDPDSCNAGTVDLKGNYSTYHEFFGKDQDPDYRMISLEGRKFYVFFYDPSVSGNRTPSMLSPDNKPLLGGPLVITTERFSLDDSSVNQGLSQSDIDFIAQHLELVLYHDKKIAVLTDCSFTENNSIALKVEEKPASGTSSADSKLALYINPNAGRKFIRVNDDPVEYASLIGTDEYDTKMIKIRGIQFYAVYDKNICRKNLAPSVIYSRMNGGGVMLHGNILIFGVSKKTGKPVGLKTEEGSFLNRKVQEGYRDGKKFACLEE